MTSTIDDLARQLRDIPPERDLSAIELRVWRRLDEELGWNFFGVSLSANAALATVRTSLSATALVAGLIAGATVSAQAHTEPNEFAVFSAQAPFALSTVLSHS